MSSPSPTLEGFRAAFRRPSFLLAEIAWRWSVGAVAGVLFLFTLFEFLDTLPVSRGDATLLRTRQPVLIGRAISHILRGTLSRAVLAALLAVVALSFLWIVAASIGRLATVRTLLEYFREKLDEDVSPDRHDQSTFRHLVPLHFLRVAVVLAALLAFAGAAILASFISSDAKPRPGLVFIIFLPLAGLICIAWSALNWLLGFAAIFAVRDCEDALGSLSAAVTFCRTRLRPVSAVSTWVGLAHLVTFSVATSAVAVPLAFIQIVPVRLVFAIIVLLTLAYFAAVDGLYVARLAGYLYIAETPEASVSPASLTISPPAGQRFVWAVSPQTAVDRDELILGDVPNLGVET
jgi:hypothetical protein